MGSRCSSPIRILDTIHKLRELEVLMKERILKYEKDIASTNASVKSCIKNKSKVHAKILIRKKKIMQRDIETVALQIANIQKRISTLEGLELTKMQIDSISDATRVFSKFVSKNNIDRIDRLNDDMVDLADQLCDIDQIFAVDNIDIDETELQEEYDEIEKETLLDLPEAPTDIIVEDTEDTQIPMAV